MINILFTSAGRRVELLTAFRNAYRSLGLEGKIVAVDVDPLAPTFQTADVSYLVPPLHNPDYIRVLADICRLESISLVFPLIDPDISILSNNRIILEQEGLRVAVVSPEAVAITADKWLTVDFFRRLGLAVPDSWVCKEKIPEDLEFPLFIKPRGGSAAKDSFKVTNRDHMLFFMKYVKEPIIQAFLPGVEITTDVVTGMDGELLGIVSRQRIEVRGGEVTKGVTINDPRIINACTRIAQALPAIGPITVQCIMKDNIPYFTEINARFGGGVPLGIAAGMDSPRWLLAKTAGISVPIPPIGTYKVGLHITRCDRSFFIERKDLSDVAGHIVRPG
jgi:carbamoyl-phosphate synthase large subunit